MDNIKKVALLLKIRLYLLDLGFKRYTRDGNYEDYTKKIWNEKKDSIK